MNQRKKGNSPKTTEVAEIIEIEPVVDEPIEVTPIEPMEVTPIEPMPIETPSENTNGGNKTLKTIGTIAAAGAAVGAAAFGAHTVMKARENNDIYESDDEEDI